ncbi:MAG: hypothetical protein L6R41_007191 [Letrouitia leprolyta]|nr:MAG: hypothetical protein L6R41_007191 [Letrouitia leprolyta]
MLPLKTFFATTVVVTFGLRYYASSLLPSRYILIDAALFFIIQFITWLLWQRYVYLQFFGPLRGIPGPSGGNLLLGQRLRMLGEVNGQSFRKWQYEIPNDGVIKFLDMLGSETVVVLGPKALAEVTVHKAYDFIKPPQLRGFLAKILGVGLFLAEGDEHRIQRKQLNPAFAFRPIKDLYPVFWSKAGELIEVLMSQYSDHEKLNGALSQPIKVNEWTSRVTLDIIGIGGFGHDFNSIKDPNGKLTTTYKRIFSPGKSQRVMALLGWILPRWLLASIPIKRNNDIETASKVIKSTCYDLVQQSKRQLAETDDTNPPTDLLSVTLSAGHFSDLDLVNQLMTFLLAGHETTASAFSWAICMLCKHPDMQTRLREEVRAGVPDPRSSDSSISASQVDRLPYLNAVCNEILRVYPPIPITVRVAGCDTSIIGYHIPKGTAIFISPWATNANKELWGEDAEVFNPERWMDEKGNGNNSGGADTNYSFLTFLHGPRSCIGQGFARGELLCLVAAWVGCFETSFEVAGTKVEVRNGLASRPADLSVRVKVLESW